MEQDACVDLLCKFAARSLLSQHEVSSLAWFHKATRSPYGQLADQEVGLLMRHWFDVYLLYALEGSITSHTYVVVVLRAQSETHQLAPVVLNFPPNEGSGPAGVVSLACG